MKNTTFKWSLVLLSLFLTVNLHAIEVLIYSNDFTSIEALTSGSSSTIATSSDGKYAVVQGSTTTSGTAVMGKTAYFTNTSSTGHMLFYDLPLNNGGRIVVTWGSTKRNLSVNCNTTLLSPSPVSYTSSLQTTSFTIPASENGLSDFKLFTSGGSGIYIFGIEVYTNSSGPIVDACTIAGVNATINIIDAATATINVTVPYVTNITSLIPTFTLGSGTSFVTAADETTPKDFTSVVPYQFTDGADIRTYNVTVTKTPASTACNITAFSIPNQVGVSQFIPAVGPAKDSIIVTMPYSTTPAEIAALIPTYTTSPLILSNIPNTGIAQNFTTPVKYTITAEDGVTSKEYWVRVKKAPASLECNILNFSMNVPVEDVVIDQFAKTITVKVAGTDNITSVTPTIGKSLLSTVDSPVFPQDFSSPVVIRILAEDGIQFRDYTVTVTKDATAPTYTSVPVDGAIGTSLAGLITLTFNENVKLGTGDILLGGSTILNPNTIPVSGSKTVTIPFTGLSSLTTYTVSIPAGRFEDMFGNDAAASTITFTTADGVFNFTPTNPYYASHMDGANFPVPAFITGGSYEATADIKATTSTQYGAYKLGPGQVLTITSSRVGSILANVYAPGGNRTFTITNNKNATVSNGSFSNYENKGTEISQVINENSQTQIFITNTSSVGDIYIPYIYLSDVNLPTETEKQVWCK